jgi:glycosyltransferase involved in cell wall biosynthesis
VAHKPYFSGTGEDLLVEIEKFGYKIYRLRGEKLFSLIGLWDLFRIIYSNKINIIHCWDSFSIMARFIAKITGAKVVDRIGNPPIDESARQRVGKRISSVFLDGVIFASKGSREAHHQNGPNILRWCKEKVVYNSIHLSDVPEYKTEDKNKIREKYSISKNDTVLINMGMYNKQKSQEYLIKALPGIIERHKKLKLLLVGWGERENLLQHHIRILNLGEFVTLTGKKHRHEVFEFLSVADIYVSSSLWEGLPNSILEAMAFKLPVVATDVIGNNEAVKHQKTGFLIPVGNLSSFGEAIVNLIVNPDLRMRMGQEGRNRIKKHFTEDRFIKQHEEFYETIIG